MGVVRIRTAKIAELIAERTSELEASNEALKSEMEVRRNTERKLNRQNDALQLIHMITSAANTAQTLEDALKACVQYVCFYTEWPVGHAFCMSDDGIGVYKSTGIWHLDDPEKY